MINGITKLSSFVDIMESWSNVEIGVKIQRQIKGTDIQEEIKRQDKE